MRIGVIGGLGRTEGTLKEVATAAGHQLVFHEGHMSGPGSNRLRALVDWSDVVVIVTDVNSHAAVAHARSLAKRAHRPVRMMRRLGKSGLRDLLH